MDDADVTRLAAEVAALYGRRPEVPAGVDEAIAALARQRAGQMRRMRLLLRWGGAAAAVAAVVLVALRVAMPPARPPVFHADARVTILDAFSLARQIKAGKKIDKTWDANEDGVVDQRDVEAIARRAVELPKGGTP